MTIKEIMDDIFDIRHFYRLYEKWLACCSEEEDFSPAPLRDSENLSSLASQRQTSRDDFPRTLPYYTAGFT